MGNHDARDDGTDFNKVVPDVFDDLKARLSAAEQRATMLQIDLTKTGADLIDKQGKWERAEQRANDAEALIASIADTENPEHYGNARDALHSMKLRCSEFLARKGAADGK